MIHWTLLHLIDNRIRLVYRQSIAWENPSYIGAAELHDTDLDLHGCFQGKTTNGAKPKAAPNGRAGGAPTISPGPGNGASVPPEPEAAASYIQKLLDEPEPKSICDDPSLVSARSKISAWINKRRRIMAERAQLVSHRAEALQAKDKHVTETQFSKANTAVLDVRQTTDRIEQKTREHSEADAVVGKGQEDLVSIIFQVAQSKKEKASNLGQAMKVEHQVAAEASREKDSTADQHSVKHQSIVKWTAESEEWIESQEKALDTEKLSVQAQMTEAVAPLELDRDRSAAKALEVAAQIKELEEALAAKRKEMKETRDRHEALSRKVDGTRKEYKAQLDEVDRKSKLLDEWRNGVQRNWTLANEHLNSANEARKASQKILHNSFVLGNMTQQRVERLLEASEDYTCVANVKRSFEETIGRVRGEELKANGGVKAALERVVQETAAVERVEAELDRVLGDIARAEEAVVLAKKRQDRHMADRDRWIASGNYKNADKAETAIKFEADEADKASAEVRSDGRRTALPPYSSCCVP